jgi:ABC-type sugar transport system substrate-binding protein
LAVLLSAALAAAMSARRAPVQAQATVRIARTVTVTEDTWRQERSARKREIMIVENGRPIIVRIIEFE